MSNFYCFLLEEFWAGFHIQICIPNLLLMLNQILKSRCHFTEDFLENYLT